MLPCFIALSVLLASSWLYVRTFSRRRGRLPLPPGPPASWFGSVQGLPQSHRWLKYAEWTKLYGDLIYIHAFGNPVLILNSAAVADDLLEKRGSKYSSRPVRVMVQELMGLQWLFSSLPYGLAWKKRRQTFSRHFHANNSASFYPVITESVQVLLRNLERSPENFSHHVRRTTTSIAMEIAYGHKVSEDGDLYVTLANKALAGLGAAGIFGTYLVDYVPILKYVPSWMPGATFQREATAWRDSSQKMLDLPFQEVREKMANGTAAPCFAATELNSWLGSEQNVEDYQIIKDVSAIIYAGGADTTVSTINSFILAMAMHPEIQKKAQRELDSFLKGGRLPSYDDRDMLPFVTNIVWECLRWNPVAPLGLSHYVCEDDEYNGFMIPKGTTVVPNVWKMLHDETVYPDPMVFDPSRFANPTRDDGSKINPEPIQAFGFSRRICPGRFLALDVIWLTVASVLATFDISEPADSNASTIRLKPDYTSSLISHPKPFNCDITPRSKASLEMMHQSS